MGFSKLLREGIWDIHSMADSSTVAQDMQEAKTTFEDMKKITAGLYYIYNTLEDAIEQNNITLTCQKYIIRSFSEESI
jgi:heme oxygenase